MRDENDRLNDTVEELAKRLRVALASDPRSRAAILARVRGRRPAPWRAALLRAWEPSVPFLAAAALIVAALAVGYGARVLLEPRPMLVEAGPAQPAAPELTPAVDDGRVRVLFVLADSTARSVKLVGDFNGWGEPPAVLSDPAGAGVWTVTLMLPPGRHTYAFLVNDSVWTIDPRAATTVQDDYGRLSSVVLVTQR